MVWRFCAFVLLLSSVAVAAETPASKKPTGPAAAIPHQYFSLIRVPAIQQDLELTTTQISAVRRLTDRLDPVYFRVRSMAGAAGQAAVLELLAEMQTGLNGILSKPQQLRLDQIARRVQGPGMLLDENVANELTLDGEQLEKIKKVLQSTNEQVSELRQAASKDKTVAASLTKRVNQARKDEVDQIWATLNTSQQRDWVTLVGDQFDLSQIKPGPFKAPEFSPTSEWVNSQPYKLSDLRNKVVVLHFYAFGCSNCINNYPSYRRWLQEFAGRDVVLIGIHTPETQRERDIESVRTRAAEAELKFPILADNDKSNWTAWGNTMWPTVYVIDKQGYLREWWQGELNWQGAPGEKNIQARIEQLLKE